MLAVGFAGVVLINFQSGGFGGFSLNGDGAIILSALAYSISGVLIKRFSQTDNPVALSGWQFLAGGIIMSAFAFALGGRIHMQAGVKRHFDFALSCAYFRCCLHSLGFAFKAQSGFPRCRNRLYESRVRRARFRHLCLAKPTRRLI